VDSGQLGYEVTANAGAKTGVCEREEWVMKVAA
jgi:hypothetical protein